jgi:hypothetical protein
MRKYLFCFLILLVSITANAQDTDIFKPYKSTALRLPSVPIIVNDPYFSIWSPYNQLTDGSTRHWTNSEKAIDGLLRVDNTTYRFMGVGKPYILKSILPMADEGAWTAKTSRTYSDDKWANLSYDDSSWGY